MNSIITWTDEHGSGVRGLPKKVGTVQFYRVDGEEALPGEAEVGDLAATDGRPQSQWVRLEDGWRSCREIQVVNDTEQETENLYDMTGGIVRVHESTVRISIQVTGMAPTPVVVLGTDEPRLKHPPSQVSTPTGKVPDWECRRCGAVTSDRELIDELGCLEMPPLTG